MRRILLSTKARYRLGINILFFDMGLLFASWAGRIPDVQAALRLNDAELGSALFGASLGQIPAMLLSGILVNRLGSRRMLTIGLLLYASALVLLGLAGSFIQLFGALFLFGVGGNLFDNAINTQAVGIERLYRRSIMASAHALWSFGGVAGAVTGGVLASWAVRPLLQFFITALLSGCALVLLRRWTLPRDFFAPQANKGQPSTLTDFSAQSDPATSPFTNKHAGKSRHFQKPASNTSMSLRRIRPDMFILLLGVIAFGSMATEGTIYDWNSVYFTSVVQAPEAFTRAGYIACMSAMVLGRCLGDRIIAALGYVTVLRISGLFMSAGMALMIALPSLIPASIGAALVGFGMAAGIPICFSLAGKCRTVSPSIAISLVTAISFSGFMFCPPIIGHLAHAWGLRLALVPIAATGLIITIFAPLLRRTLKHVRVETGTGTTRQSACNLK